MIKWFYFHHCPGCKELVRWWQRKAPSGNNSWHRRCWLSNDKAYKICNELCDYYKLPTSHELYVYQCAHVDIQLDRCKKAIIKKIERALYLFKL